MFDTDLAKIQYMCVKKKKKKEGNDKSFFVFRKIGGVVGGRGGARF